MSDAICTNTREYEVLYFKRKNKVHKSKGVSKMDGRLVVDTVTNAVKLFDEGQTVPTHSSINTEITKRDFEVDEEFSLAQYEVQIVSKFNISGSIANTRTSAVAASRRPLSTLQPSQKSLHKKIKQVSLVKRKAIPCRKSSTLDKPSWQNRKPPAQPKVTAIMDIEASSDNDKQEKVVMNGIEATLLQKKRSPVSRERDKFVPLSTPSIASPKRLSSLLDDVGTLVLPPSILSVLRPHQRNGVVFLWNALTRETSKGAILADSMGMGKTLMTIATVCALHRRCKQHRFIIVCPSSLVQNWAKEFDKWLGRASQPKRVVVKKGGEEGLQTLRGFSPIKPNQSEILIISYDLFRMNAPLLKEAKQIGLLVVDEGHRLKNSAGSLTLSALTSLPCEARLLITGTPIQNNLSEFHAMASFCVPGLLGSIQDFRREYERPIAAANRRDATAQQQLVGKAQSRALEEITTKFMLRRLAKDVLTDMLPPRIEMLLFCKPSSSQCDIYRTITQGHTSDPLSTLTKLRKLCSHPDLLDNQNRCIGHSGKLFVLAELLKEIRETGEKVVVVSCFTSTLTMIEQKVVIPKNWSYKRLDGATTQTDRQPLVDSFNRATADQSFLFLLSSKAGGMGLNLVGANRLVMFDADYNPATDHQAMARIYRPGQTKPTFIYRLFTSGTLEEVVYQRQAHKDNLSTMTVDKHKIANDDGTSKFTAEELRDCFTLKNTACDTMTKMKWGETDCTDHVVSNIVSEHNDVLAYVYTVPSAIVQPSKKDLSIYQSDMPSSKKKEGRVSTMTDSEEDNDSESDEEFEFSD